MTQRSRGTWTECASYVTTKDPTKEWLVETNEFGDFRCRDRDNPKAWCPAWIFSKTHPKTCKHIERFKTHPEDGVSGEKAADSFGLAVRRAFIARFGGLVSLPPRYTLVKVEALPLEHRQEWKAFVDDLRLLMPRGVEVSTVPLVTPKLGVRRIVLDD